MKKFKIITPHGEYVLEIKFDRMIVTDSISPNVSSFYRNGEVVAIIPKQFIIVDITDNTSAAINDQKVHQ